MSSRDEELDAFEKEQKRYIEKPEELSLTNGQICWLDAIRMCGPDCMAYNVEELNALGEHVQGSQKCIVLSSMLAGRDHNMVAISALRRRRAKDEDDARAESMKNGVPNPFGKNP